MKHRLCTIIPTYNEELNIGQLIDEVLEQEPSMAIIVVDDSPNELTVNAAKFKELKWPDTPIICLHRQSPPKGDIVGAVKLGMEYALSCGFEYAVTMDGDRQHNPVTIPALLQALQDGNDLVGATRYIKGGSTEGLDGPFRKYASKAATFVARSLFPVRLARATDPMSGYFAVRLNKINFSALKASGFKVLLEILLTSNGLRISEVATVFRKRVAGTSSATGKVALEYLQQLIQLRLELWFSPARTTEPSSSFVPAKEYATENG